MKVSGTALWAFTNILDTKYEPCWRINVVMDDEEANKLKELKLKVKRNDEGKYEYKFKRKLNKANGEGTNPAPRVVDAAKEPFEGIIGNGSKINVQFGVYKWKNSFGAGIGADLQAVQVVDLVPYSGSGGSGSEKDEFTKVDGEQQKKAEEVDEF